MQVDRFAASMVLMAALVALPLTAFAGSARNTSQVAQASNAPQRQAQPAPAAGEGNRQIEAQIADLRRQLKITAAQQQPFDGLAQVMRQNAEEMSKLVAQQPKGGKPTAVDAVRAGQQFAQADAEGLGRLLPKLEALYGTLSEQQKRTADRLFASGPEQEQEQEQAPTPKRR